MMRSLRVTHLAVPFSLSLSADQLPVSGAEEPLSATGTNRRVERIVAQYADTVWRVARRLGVSARDLDDVAQEVMLVVVRRVDDIEASKERAFVVAATTRVVANWRRTRRRRPEALEGSMDELEPTGEVAHRGRGSSPEESLERRRGLVVLEAALSEMTREQRVAFTLFELEQLTAPEIAAQLDLPEAAVVSRLRRAREAFRRFSRRWRKGSAR
jgi:RNA polymerase sigma-70 factor (ECF subfamily)